MDDAKHSPTVPIGNIQRMAQAQQDLLDLERAVALHQDQQDDEWLIRQPLRLLLLLGAALMLVVTGLAATALLLLLR